MAADDTTAPTAEESESGVKDSFTAFELAFDAWITKTWPLCQPGTVHWHQRREAFREGFNAGVGFAA